MFAELPNEISILIQIYSSLYLRSVWHIKTNNVGTIYWNSCTILCQSDNMIKSLITITKVYLFPDQFAYIELF